jgi:hypothetical protein
VLFSFRHPYFESLRASTGNTMSTLLSILPYIYPAATLIALSLFGMICNSGATYLQEHTKAVRGQRILNALSQIADDIAATLAPQVARKMVWNELIESGVQSARQRIPEALAKAAVSDGVLGDTLGRLVNAKLTMLDAPKVATIVAGPAAKMKAGRPG